MAMPRSYEDWERVLKAAMGAELRNPEPTFRKVYGLPDNSPPRWVRDQFVFKDFRPEIHCDPTLPPDTIRVVSGDQHVDIVNIEFERDL